MSPSMTPLIAAISARNSSSDLLDADDVAARGLERGLLHGRVLASGGDAGIADQVAVVGDGLGGLGARATQAMRAAKR